MSEAYSISYKFGNFFKIIRN